MSAKVRKISIVCYAIAAICFAIVSSGYFISGNVSSGILYAGLTTAQVILSVINYVVYKRNKTE